MADLCVIDSTPAGLLAAIAAAQRGLNVVVVTEDRHVGGMQTSGLGFTNIGQRQTLGGLARQFHQRIHDHYRKTYGPNSEQLEASRDGFHFEPHVALRIYDDWLEEAGVHVVRESPVTAVRRSGTRIEAVETAAGDTIEARYFIDASYEGDALALAGCTHHLGREAQSTYGESMAGIRAPARDRGREDRALQPMDYRLCLTRNPDNRVPFTEPPGYDPGSYTWHAARLKQTPPEILRGALPLNPMPNGKTDSRTGEWVGASWSYPEASLEQRRRIELAQRHYSAGYIWFLLNEPVLPRELRDELAEWGYAADEFTDNDNWPYHVYVREGRRLVGEYVTTQADVTDDRFKPDAVAVGSFFLDVHPVRFVPDAAAPGGLLPEGSFGAYGTRPYEIAYRSLLPVRAEARNLLVPVALSASHVGFSTIRVEPTWMALGHAAGAAAALAAEDARPVQDVDVPRLQRTLTEDGQVLDARPFNEYWPRKPDPQADV